MIARSAEVTRLAADTLVIGSGAGGSCVADVLTTAGLDVLMVEEGPRVAAEAAAPRFRGAGAAAASPSLWDDLLHHVVADLLGLGGAAAASLFSHERR